jgi:SAM-dependent methyltransferase
MEELSRLIGDPTIDYSMESLEQVTRSLPRIQEKLKILEAALTSVAMVGADDAGLPDTSYSYIPLDLTEFFDAMYDLEAALAEDPDYSDPDVRHRRVDFIEAGCGPGRNLSLLRATDRFELRKIHGIDLSDPMITHGRRIFGLGEDIWTADCLTFDYAPYDVIYFYRPIADIELQKTFEDYLVRNMRSGAYVIGCGNLGLAEDRRLLAKCDGNRVYKKLR